METNGKGLRPTTDLQRLTRIVEVSLPNPTYIQRFVTDLDPKFEVIALSETWFNGILVGWLECRFWIQR